MRRNKNWKPLDDTYSKNSKLAKMIDLKDNEEQCEFCGGLGKRKYNAVYINGDLYHDAEYMECSECKGTGKVAKELSTEQTTYNLAIYHAIEIVGTLYFTQNNFPASLRTKIISELSKLKSNANPGGV